MKIRVLILESQNGYSAEAYTSDDEVRRRVLEIVRGDLAHPGQGWEPELAELEGLLHEGADIVELIQAVGRYRELKREEGFGDSSENMALVEAELRS